MRRSTLRQLRNSSARPTVALLALYLGSRSWRQAQQTGARLGDWAWRIARRDRDRAHANVRTAFPDLDEETRRGIVRDSFRHFGTSLAELLYLSRKPSDAGGEYLDIEGWEHVARSAGQKKANLIATAHCGNWELFSPAFASRNAPLAGLARPFEDSWVDEQIIAIRRHLGGETIRRGAPGAARQLLGVLRGGGNLLVLVDHDIDADSVWVPFFGKLAHTVVGPAQMAIRHSLAIIPAFAERREDGRHTMRFHPPLEIGGDEKEATAMMTRAVEEQIRRCPVQWTWMHRRWRRRPPGEGEGPRS